MRLDSYLANAGCGSRKMVKETISQKQPNLLGCSCLLLSIPIFDRVFDCGELL